ncbi:hypothetical protein [Rhizobium nepotum]|uniref:hypothetical protein n=1 Tax=Rhizobium nepotum TaxID=1035271 RepID=UPI003CE7F11D
MAYDWNRNERDGRFDELAAALDILHDRQSASGVRISGDNLRQIGAACVPGGVAGR